MGWTVETLNAVVDGELDELPADMQARFVRVCELISAVGLYRVGAPHVRHLTGAIWEMRLRGKDGIARALYVTVRDRRVVVVRAFVKKTQKTPRREIDLALRRARGGIAMSNVRDLHEKWRQNPDYREAYDELGPEFELARVLIEARASAGLTQAQLAERMQTTQSAVARLESGRVRPSTRTLEKIARCTGTRLRISFEPVGASV